jgi:zinc protease
VLNRLACMTQIWVFLVIILPMVAVGQDVARPARPESLTYPSIDFRPPHPERMQLDNGLILYLLPDSMIPMIRVRGLIHAGSLGETRDESGLAYLCANLLRLGGSVITPATEMNRQLEFAGATLESSAGRDYASVSLLTLRKDRDMGIRFLSEILLQPAFAEEPLSQRKTEILDGLRRQNDDPVEITRREFRRVLFGDHPYGRDPLGNEKTVPTFDREDLIRWHKAWYHPDRTILCITGDFQRGEMLELIQKHLGGWPRGNVPVKDPEVLPSSAVGKNFFISKDLNQSTVRIGHLGIARNNPDKIPLEVLNFILGGGGFSSRLFNRVRTESGFAYTVVSEFEESLLTGQFLAFLQTKSGNTAKATQLTQKIIREMAEETNITEEEVNLAKQSKLNDFVFEFETPADSAFLSAEIEYFGLPGDYLETYRERLSAVTLEDVKRVARKYLKPEEETLLILGAPEMRDDLKVFGEFEEIQLDKEQ